jgi:hypothetical protein
MSNSGFREASRQIEISGDGEPLFVLTQPRYPENRLLFSPLKQ